MREAALALELIIKAVIAQRIEIYGECESQKSVPPTHDVSKLWQIAGLRALKIPDRFRLLMASEVLHWSGRYAAPRLDKHWEKQNKEWRALEALEDGGVRKRLRFSTYPGFKWKDVNRLFAMADKEYWRLNRPLG
jgi:hypothetical protein